MVDRALELAEAVDHLVCCRRPWNRALCGADLEEASVTIIVDRLCSMCMEVAMSGLAEHGYVLEDLERAICPLTGENCPSEDEIDEKIIDRLRE